MAGSQTRKQRGGNLNLGKEFNALHVTQHGGAATPIYGAPVGYTGELEGGLRESARLSEYDTYFKQASGMSDVGAVATQKGGARNRNRSRKSTKSRSKKSRSTKSRSTKSRSTKSRSTKSRSTKSRSTKSRSTKSRSTKSRSTKSRSTKSRSRKQKQKQRGGARELGYDSVGSPYMLLPPSTRTGSSDFSNPLLKN